MAVGRLVVPQWMPARDRSKRLVSGALLTVYDNETTDKASIYSDAAMTVALSNPVVANSSGHFPAIYCEAGTTDDPTLYSVAISGPNGESIVNPGTFDDYQPSVDYETAAVALSEAAQGEAESAADRAEAALAEALAIQAAGDDAAAIAARAAKAANGSDFADPAAVRTNIGIPAYRSVASAAALALGLAAGDANVLTAASTTLDSTQIVTNSGSITGGIDGAEIYREAGQMFRIEPTAALGGTLASAAAAGASTITLAASLPAGLVAGVFLDIGDDSHVRLVSSVNTGTNTITLNYPLGRAVAKGETVNYRVPPDRYSLTRQKLRKISKALGTGANVTIKYYKTVDLSSLTSQDCAGNAITLMHCGWGDLEGRIIAPNITTRASQFGMFLYNCENANVENLHGTGWTEYMIQFKDCRDCSGVNIHGDATGSAGADFVANIKCSGLHPVWNVHITGVKGTSCGQAAANLTHLLKEGTYFHPFNVSADNIAGYDCQGLQLGADYGSKWAQPRASNISSEGEAVLYVSDNVPAGVFSNITAVRPPSRAIDVESHGHIFMGGMSQDAYYNGSTGADIRLTAAAYNAMGRIDFTDLPGNNSTITLNGKTITFKSSGAVAANHECNIGATVSATLVNLAGLAGAGSGGLLNDSTDPLLTPATYTAWNSALTIEYDTTGSAGDAYTLAVGVGSNATIYSFDGAATTTLKGGTQTGASNNTFIGWQGRVTNSAAGVVRFVQESSASCNNNVFVYCRIIDLIGKYTADYTLLGAASVAIAPAWDVVPSMSSVARRAPMTLEGTQTVAGNITFSGTNTTTGSWTFGDQTSDVYSFVGRLQATSSGATAAVGPQAVLYRNSASPAAADLMGELIWRGKDSGAADEDYASIVGRIIDPTAASEDGALDVYAKAAGTSAVRLTIDGQGILSTSLPTYADNAAATGGGLTAGRFYKTATGEVRIVV